MTLSTKAISALDRLPRLAGLASLTCLLSAGFTAGCEDSAAQHRVEAQRTITTASTEFRKVTAGSVTFGDEHFEQRQRELNAVASRVSNLPNAEAGQQAAGALLAAEALSELAAMHLAQAQRLQNRNRHDRETLRSVVDAASRLAARADAQADQTISSERAALQQQRQMAEQGLNMLQQRIAALEGPIGDRTRRNVEGESEADRLRAQANDLVRRAIELGHAAGFPSFQQAISTRRDADGIDYEIAMRELELDYELNPEHKLAQLQVEHLNLLVSSIRETLDEFDRLEQLLSSDLARTQQRISELRSEVNLAMQTLQQRIDGELNEQYESARGYLERAETQARQAVSRLRGDQGSAARLLQAKVQETLGQSLWAEANGIAEHLKVLSQIIQAGGAIGDAAEHRASYDALTAKRRQLIEQAQAAFSEAEQSLSGVGGRAANAVEQFRQNLQRASAAVGGQEIGPAPTAFAPERSQAGSAATAASGQGFSSPQEAVEFLRSMDATDQSHAKRFFSAVDTTSPTAAAIVDMMRSLMGVMVDFDAAVRERFGDDADTSMNMSISFDNARIESESGSRATIAYDTPMGPDTLDLISRNGQWFIDSSDLAEGMPGVDQMDEATLRRIADAMNSAFQDLTRRVRAGEFSTVEQLDQAAMGVMMQVMMQAFQ